MDDNDLWPSAHPLVLIINPLYAANAALTHPCVQHTCKTQGFKEKCEVASGDTENVVWWTDEHELTTVDKDGHW